MGKQSLSKKYVLIIFLTKFFSSMLSLEPFCFIKAFSKYCFAVITLPSLSSNFKAKSRKIHNNEGKYFAISSSSLSFAFNEFELFLILRLFDKFKIRLKLFKATSSIVPNEL